METVFKALIVYALLLLIFRISGKRTLADITTFDLLLTLIISESVQQAMISDDASMVGAGILVVTLVGADILLSILKYRYQGFARIVDGVSTTVVKNGVIDKRVAQSERIDEDDILAAARKSQGLERLDQIKHAVLEEGGGISIIPKKIKTT